MTVPVQNGVQAQVGAREIAAHAGVSRATGRRWTMSLPGWREQRYAAAQSRAGDFTLIDLSGTHEALRARAGRVEAAQAVCSREPFDLPRPCWPRRDPR